jgi:hypothetical protein
MVISPTHSVLLLVFGLPAELDAISLDIRSKLATAKQFDLALQFVATFTYDRPSALCTALLTRSRAEAFIKGGYEAAIVNTAVWKLQSERVPCSALRVVGDVDSLHGSVDVPKVKGKSLSNAQRMSWLRAMGAPV